jgi:uncharacterized damage-inducible protein DinB
VTERPEPPHVADERATLLGFLDFQRATFAIKCADLTPDQLVLRASPPSTLSLLGLARHIADCERGWFREFAGEKGPGRDDVTPLFFTDEELNLDFDGTVAEQAAVDEAFDAWRAEIAHAGEIVAAHSLDDTFTRPRKGDTFTLRWVIVHMIEEYARHNGHADLLREAIDGTTGE